MPTEALKVRTWFRIFWACAMVAVAFVTVQVELDRQASRGDYHAELILPAFRSQSQSAITWQAIAAGDWPLALTEARRLVSRRPIPSESLTALAIASGQTGDATLSSQALTLAAGRGWRDPIAQEAMLHAAATSGDWLVASQRFDAIGRVDAANPALGAIFPIFAVSEAGRLALVDRLKEGPPWKDALLTFPGTGVSSRDLRSTLDLAERQSVTFDCAALAQSVVQLLRSGHGRDATQLWGGKCAHDVRSADALSPDLVSPFGWMYPSQGGMDRQFDPRDGRSVMRVHNDAMTQGVVAERYVVLQPGTHRVHAVAANGQSELLKAGGGQLRLQAVCLLPSKEIEARPIGTLPDGSFLVSGGCPVQRLSLMMGRGDAEIAKLVID